MTRPRPTSAGPPRQTTANLPATRVRAALTPDPGRADRRGVDRRRPAGASRVAVPRSATLGLDLQGGLEVVLEAVPAGEPDAAGGRSRPLGRDHAQPHRQARRRGAGGPQAGQQPDLDRAPGRRRPRRGGASSARPLSSSSTTSRRALTGAVDRRAGLPADPAARTCTTCSRTRGRARSIRNEGRPSQYYLFRAQGKGCVAGPMPTERALRATEAAREAGVTADALPSGLRIFARAGRDGHRHLRRPAAVCPGVGRETAPTDNCPLPLQARPEGPSEDRFRR